MVCRRVKIYVLKYGSLVLSNKICVQYILFGVKIK